MPSKTHLRIITPEKIFLDEDVDMVIMRTTSGDIGVLPGHTLLTTTLSYGVIIITNDDKERRASLFGGFSKIDNDSVTILTEAAEWPSEIDSKRASDAIKRAEDRLKKREGIDIIRAEVALRKANIRLELSSYKLDEAGNFVKMDQV